MLRKSCNRDAPTAPGKAPKKTPSAAIPWGPGRLLWPVRRASQCLEPRFARRSARHPARLLTRIGLNPGQALGPVLGLALAVALQAGCASDPARDPRRALATVPADALAAAEALQQDGKPAAAAAAYLELAAAAQAPARGQLQLAAVASLLDAANAAEAGAVLADIHQPELTGTQRQSARLFSAELALRRGNSQQARTALKRVNQGALPKDLRVRSLRLQAAVDGLDGQPLQAARSLEALDRLLRDDPVARLDNQVALLLTLSSLGPEDLREAAAGQRGSLRGWVELAALFAQHPAPGPGVTADYQRWRARNGGHPALANLSEGYFAALAGGYPAGTDLLVWLPEDGRYGGAGAMIRAGIRAARDADPGADRPRLRFTSGAAETGADLVIGPLDKQAVTELAGRAALAVPTLALNRSSDHSPTSNLFQFALAPEDESRNAADYAWAAGTRRAALIYPDDGFGERLTAPFRRQWRILGGEIADERPYAPGGPSADAMAAAALVPPAPSADVIFLVAGSADAGAILDQLRQAGSRLPVIATSHVYNGDQAPERDRALAGLYFVDIPWMLDQERTDALSRNALRRTQPKVQGSLARLYAMGIDSYRLAPRIAGMARLPGSVFPGATGGLTVDAGGLVQRRLQLAQFTPRGPVLRQAMAPAAGQTSAP